MPFTKKLPRISCIYGIKCLLTGKFYIGSTVHFYYRLWRHFRDLRTNSHINTYLQRAYNKYTEPFFVFGIIEICSEQQLLTREGYYIDIFKSGKRRYGYNIADVNPDTGRPSKQPEHILKLNAKKAVQAKIDKGDLIPDAMVSRIRELYKEGHRMADICNIVGLKIKTVSTVCKNQSRFDENYEYMPQKDWRQVPDDVASKIAKLYQTGYSIKQIKKEISVGRYKIENSLRKHGVPTRKAEKHVYLNTSTGIYYNSLQEISQLTGFDQSLLLKKMKGHVKNNTDFIIA